MISWVLSQVLQGFGHPGPAGDPDLAQQRFWTPVKEGHIRWIHPNKHQRCADDCSELGNKHRLNNMGGSRNGGIQTGWSIVGNPIDMDDDWGYPYFRKPPLIRNVGFTRCRMFTMMFTMPKSENHISGWDSNHPQGLWHWVVHMKGLSDQINPIHSNPLSRWTPVPSKCLEVAGGDRTGTARNVVENSW